MLLLLKPILHISDMFVLNVVGKHYVQTIRKLSSCAAKVLRSYMDPSRNTQLKQFVNQSTVLHTNCLMACHLSKAELISDNILLCTITAPHVPHSGADAE